MNQKVELDMIQDEDENKTPTSTCASTPEATKAFRDRLRSKSRPRDVVLDLRTKKSISRTSGESRIGRRRQLNDSKASHGRSLAPNPRTPRRDDTKESTEELLDTDVTKTIQNCALSNPCHDNAKESTVEFFDLDISKARPRSRSRTRENTVKTSSDNRTGRILQSDDPKTLHGRSLAPIPRRSVPKKVTFIETHLELE